MGKILLQFIRLYRRFINRKYGWHGNYKTWKDAVNAAKGYDDDAILKKILTSTLKVKNGEAVFEQDGRLYDTVSYSWPLLANLLEVAIKNDDRLHVIDFGGSLGSTLVQNKNYFQHLKEVKWSVVEQKNYVTAGKEHIAGNGLDFFYTIEEAIEKAGMPDALMISGCLPYLPEPYQFLEHLTGFNIPVIILEKTYFNPAPGERITIQHVPPYFYDVEASYPAWYLDYEKVKAILAKKYVIDPEYKNEEFLYLDGEKVDYRGFVATLKSSGNSFS